MSKKTALTLSGVLILVLALLLWFGSKIHSPSFDEAIHIAAAGLLTQTGKEFPNPETSPLVKGMTRLGWLGLKFAPPETLTTCAEESFWALSGDSFLFHNQQPADVILGRARLPFILLTLLLATGLTAIAKILWGNRGALLSLALFIVEPAVLANGYLVEEDMPLAAISLFAVCSLLQYHRHPNRWAAGSWGFFAGAASLCKLSGLILWPMGAFFLIQFQPRSGTRGRDAMAGLGVAFFTLLAGNGFQIQSILHAFSYQYSHWFKGYPGFLFGIHSDRGWAVYHPVALLLKTTPFFLILFLWTALTRRGAAGLKTSREEGDGDRTLLLVHILAFIGSLCLSRLTLGIRLALPILTLQCLLIGSLFSGSLSRSTKFLGLALLFGHALNSLSSFPHPHAYFSPLAGGQTRGWKILAESNVDWGQDLPSLKRFMEERSISSLRLSYFGIVDPAHYGIRYQYLPGFGRTQSHGVILPANGSRQFVAISINNLLGIYFERKDLYRWLASRKHIGRPGGSLFVFEVTNDFEAHHQMMHLYQEFGFQKEAGAETLQMLRISPSHPEVLSFLENGKRNQPVPPKVKQPSRRWFWAE